jgi:molybdopterin/thiamine biosynthesis adenylyltransferase
MASLNCNRHLEVFDAAMFNPERVDVIGCGAVGSRILLSLAKLGIDEIHGWDFDTVESHNIPNQVFGIKDVGAYKVEALHSIVQAMTGTQIAMHNEAVDGSQSLGPYVFIATDTMSSRKEIFKKAIENRRNIKLMVDVRMGADVMRIYAINPVNPTQARMWKETLFDDDEVDEHVCGSTVSVGPTAEILSGMAVWQMIRFAAEKKIEEHEIIFATRPSITMTRDFDAIPAV